MKLKFKVQPYQTSAVESVVDCFAGQVNTSGIAYRIDPGVQKNEAGWSESDLFEQTGFKNADIQLTDAQLLSNIHAVQRRQCLFISDELVFSAGCKVRPSHSRSAAAGSRVSIQGASRQWGTREEGSIRAEPRRFGVRSFG